MDPRNVCLNWKTCSFQAKGFNWQEQLRAENSLIIWGGHSQIEKLAVINQGVCGIKWTKPEAGQGDAYLRSQGSGRWSRRTRVAGHPGLCNETLFQNNNNKIQRLLENWFTHQCGIKIVVGMPVWSHRHTHSFLFSFKIHSCSRLGFEPSPL